MSPEQPQIITTVPGMEDIQAAEASRAPIIIENPGPQTLRTAIGSPDAPTYGANVHNGPVVEVVDALPASPEVSVTKEATDLGETMLKSTGMIDTVPGMELAEVSQPDRTPITIENPGPQTLRTAIGSPDAPTYGANVSGAPINK